MDYFTQELGAAADKIAHVISLRCFDVSDADDLMLWATDERATYFCRWDTFIFREQAIDYINSNVNHPYLRAICLNNRAIGAISVTPNSGNDRYRAELGYVLASGYWGRGIGTTAVKLVSSRLFHEWPHLERLEALVDVENNASLRVLEKAGFRREGTLESTVLKGGIRYMVTFSLLSTDPQADGIVHSLGMAESTLLCSSLEALKLW